MLQVSNSNMLWNLQVSPLCSSYKPAFSTARTSLSVARCSCRRVSSLRCSSCTLPNDVAHCQTISVLALNSHLEKANHCKLLALAPRNHIYIPVISSIGSFANSVSQKDAESIVLSSTFLYPLGHRSEPPFFAVEPELCLRAL